MPIYEYRKKSGIADEGCDNCQGRFEVLQKMADLPLEVCPHCHTPVERLISSFSFKENIYDRAKNSGFQKLVKKDKGVYEREF